MAEKVEKIPKVKIDTKFGEVTQTAPGIFTTSNQVLYDLLEKNGVPDAKNTLTAVMDGYIDTAAQVAEEFLKDQIIKTGEQAQIRMGTGAIRLTSGLNGHQEVKNPKTGELHQSYGSPFIRIGMKVPPKMRAEGGRYDLISKDIEKAFKAKRK